MATTEFKTGNFSLLGKIDPLTRLIYVSSIQDEETMKKLLIDTINNNDEYKIANTLFNLKYKDSKYIEYVLRLLDKNLIDLSLIKDKVADDIINNTSWGYIYFLTNLEKINGTIKNSFINYAVTSEITYNQLLNEIIENTNIEIRDNIMYSLIRNNPEIKEEDLLRFINNDLNIKSRIPFFLASLSKRYDKYKNIKNIMINNFRDFFEAESSKKMELYNIFSDKVSIDEIEEYKDLYKFYQVYSSSDVDQVLTALINRNDYIFLNDIIVDSEIKFVGTGTTTTVYRVKDKVIKFTKNKHEENNPINNNLYLLAPTITKYIPNKEGIMVLEIQDYLSDTYNGEKITKEDIINWNIEMEKLGYVVTDPLCSYLKPDNFGFLKDYRDANMNDQLEIPEWFKKRPLVLYDIDLIYRKDDEHKKIMKFH